MFFHLIHHEISQPSSRYLLCILGLPLVMIVDVIDSSSAAGKSIIKYPIDFENLKENIENVKNIFNAGLP